MKTACITTFLSGDYTKGQMRMYYRIATVSTIHENSLSFSTSNCCYSTPQGARAAAKRKGLSVLPGVAQGFRAARRWLGLDAGHDLDLYDIPSPLSKQERFTGTYADSFAA